MDKDEIELVARAAYEQGTGRSGWGEEIEGMDATWAYWREIAHAVLAALDRHRQAKTDVQNAHQVRMISELGDLAHHGEEATR